MKKRIAAAACGVALLGAAVFIGAGEESPRSKEQPSSSKWQSSSNVQQKSEPEHQGPYGYSQPMWMPFGWPLFGSNRSYMPSGQHSRSLMPPDPEPSTYAPRKRVVRERVVREKVVTQPPRRTYSTIRIGKRR